MPEIVLGRIRCVKKGFLWASDIWEYTSYRGDVYRAKWESWSHEYGGGYSRATDWVDRDSLSLEVSDDPFEGRDYADCLVREAQKQEYLFKEEQAKRKASSKVWG